jgi:hypothetical protein
MISKINQNWVFGKNAGLDFGTTTPTPSSSNLINTGEGCASISDAGGTLILYTDGWTVWDGGNNIRAQGLLGHPSSTQSAIIVPNPGNAAQYYVFTADGHSGGNHHVDGILIDVSTWDVTQLSDLMTMPPTAGYSPTEKLTAIQSDNCDCFWVVTIIQKASIEEETGPGILRVFRVDSAGVHYDVPDTPMGVDVNDLGYLKGSKNGKRIAIANWHNKNVQVYLFDNSAGTIDLSSLIDITVPYAHGQPENHPRVPYGVEFSPNSNILYYTVLGNNSSDSLSTGYVYQHDLINPSTVHVWNHPNEQGNDEHGRYALGALQLGMDDRIYIAQDGEQALGVIANPDVLGTGCNLTFGSLALASGSVCYMGLPNLIPNPCDLSYHITYICEASTHCGPGRICFDYSLPTTTDAAGNPITGSVTIKLDIYQNGALLTQFISPTLTSGSSYCFNITPSSIPGIDTALGGFDFVATGVFAIGNTPLGHIMVGSPPDGITEGRNNDYLIACKTCADIKKDQDAYLSRKCGQKVNLLPRINCDCLHDGPEADSDCRCICHAIELPDIEPCISIRWGDSKCDCIETDDVEVLCITVCNCYSNVAFNNLTIGHILITDMAGNPVPLLPDGTPSVQALPSGPICFGDIGPCKESGRPTCVSRELVLYTRGAVGQDYLLSFEGVCFTISYQSQSKQCFIVTLCRDE